MPDRPFYMLHLCNTLIAVASHYNSRQRLAPYGMEERHLSCIDGAMVQSSSMDQIRSSPGISACGIMFNMHVYNGGSLRQKNTR